MSISTLILGESGTGKTTSLRNLDTKEYALIQVIKKPMPFKSKGVKLFVSDSWDKIIAGIEKAIASGIKIIVIDDVQYIMANEFMRRSSERGYDKFTEIANHMWSILNRCLSFDDDIRIYFLSHVTTDDSGTIKFKTIGKMLDEKITVEGMFTIVLRTGVSDGQYFFRCVNNGSDTVKSPVGMFETETIDNDLKIVDNAICDYYGIENK